MAHKGNSMAKTLRVDFLDRRPQEHEHNHYISTGWVSGCRYSDRERRRLAAVIPWLG